MRRTETKCGVCGLVVGHTYQVKYGDPRTVFSCKYSKPFYGDPHGDLHGRDLFTVIEDLGHTLGASPPATITNAHWFLILTEDGPCYTWFFCDRETCGCGCTRDLDFVRLT